MSDFNDDSDEEGGSADYVLNAHLAHDAQDAAQRMFRANLHGNLPGNTSVIEKYTAAQIDSLRQPMRAKVLALEAEFRARPPDVEYIAPTRTSPGQFTLNGEIIEKGDTVSLEDVLSMRAAAGLPSEGGPARVRGVQGAAPPRSLVRDQQKFVSLGSLIGMPVVSAGAADQLEFVSGGAKSAQEFVSKGAKTLQAIHMGDIPDESKDKYPSIPKRQATFVDSLSKISLLNQPRPLRMDEVDSMFARIGRGDPFAAAAFGAAGPGLLLPATARETKRILNHEMGFVLESQGYDFSQPSNIFENFFGSRPKAPVLDSARTHLMQGYVNWAAALASKQALSPAFTFDLGAVGGFTWTNKSYRDPSTGIVLAVGRLRALIGEAAAPYGLNIKDPLLDILFPDGNWKGAANHPVQAWSRNTGNFLLSFFLDGAETRDVTGRHWLPLDGIKTAVYRSINTARHEAGGAQMMEFLTDDAQIRAISVNPRPSPLGFDRGMLGMNPFGAEIMDWSAVRGAQAAMVASNPLFSPTSSASKLQLWGGSIKDPYSVGDPVDIEPKFKFGGITLNAKTGKLQFKAPHISMFQLDHVVPLSYAWQHGVDEVVAEALRMFEDDVTPVRKGGGRPLMRGDIVISGGTLGPGPGDPGLDNAGPGTKKYLQIMEAVSRIGYATNPNQYALVGAAINQAKGDKGPGNFLPYGWARTRAEHLVNLGYVERWRSIIPDSRKAIENAMGRSMPNLLVPDREDELAMRRVELGVDTENRFERPFGSSFVEYLDSPRLTDPTLYQNVRCEILRQEFHLAIGAVTWGLIPRNQLYLMMRDHLIDGWINHLAPDLAEGEKLAPIGTRFSSLVDWYRRRYAGIPVIGKTDQVRTIDEQIYALHDLARSGRIEEVLRISGDGDVLKTRRGLVYAARPGEIFAYTHGLQDPFGGSSDRSLRPFEGRRIPGFTDELKARYSMFLETGDRNFLLPGSQIEGMTSSSVAKTMSSSVISWQPPISFAPSSRVEFDRSFWLENFRIWDAANETVPTGDLLGTNSKLIQRDVFRAVEARLAAEHVVLGTSQVGREALDIIPGVQGVARLFRAGKWEKGLRKAVLEYGVKFLNLSIRGSQSVLSASNLPGYIAMEYLSAKSVALSGLTVGRDLPFGAKAFGKGGLFPFVRDVKPRTRAQITEQITLLRKPSVDADDAFASRAELRRLLRLRETAREALSGDLSYLQDAASMRGPRGAVTRFMIEHPRAVAAAAKLTRLPVTAISSLKAPFMLEEAVAARISAGKVLKPLFGVLGGGLMALGVAEGVVRYRRGMGLAGRPYDSLNDGEKAEIEAYTEPGLVRMATQTFLDAGAPISPRAMFTKWGAAGAVLATGNIVGRQLVLGRSLQDTAYASSRIQRLLGDSATLQEQYRYSEQIKQRQRLGILQTPGASDSGQAKRVFNRVDSASYFNKIRETQIQRGDSTAVGDRRIAAARQAWRMVPAIDSLGYEFSTARFGKRIEHSFMQAKQGVSDVSLVAVGGKFDTLQSVRAPGRLDRIDRESRMALEGQVTVARQARANANFEKLVHEESLWKSMLLGVQMLKETVRPHSFAEDSADVARDLQSRRALRSRDSVSTRSR